MAKAPPVWSSRLRSAAPARLFVQVVNPANELREFDRFDVQIDNETGLAASCQHTMQLQVLAGIDFLMRHIRLRQRIPGARPIAGEPGRSQHR
jgi:hypothetical protein